jgi:F0F1-type ATP synthase membrane subunit b/b'
MFDEKFWLAVSFIVFIVFIYKFLGNKINSILNEKSQQIASDLLIASQAKEKAEKLLQEAQDYNQQSLKYAEKLKLDTSSELNIMYQNATLSLQQELAKITEASQKRLQEEEQIDFWRAFKIGCWQCIAMIPGVSRSASSIIGGMQQQLSRKLAAEFSFFLAVPTMAAATGYKLLKGYKQITPADLQLFAIGNIVAFVVALLAIRFFIQFLQRNGFKVFAYYRIAAGTLLLALLFSGYLKA